MRADCSDLLQASWAVSVNQDHDERQAHADRT